MPVPPFNVYFGTELVRRGDGEAELALELAEHHLNRRGVAHGGVVAALLDSALGAAVITAIPKEWWCATISLSIQFISGARPGRLTARGRVLRRGRAVAYARGEAVDARGRVVASAEGSWHLWPHHPGLERAGAEPFVTLRGSGERLRVGKILAVGRNYAEHVKEMGSPPSAPPVLFMKPPGALVQDGGVVLIPPQAGEVHHEVELVVVIGAPGKRIPREQAPDHVLGYAVGLDMTLRDVQARAKREGGPWFTAKGFDTSAPVSLVAPAAEVGDGSGLRITLDVNGERRQDADTAAMLRSVAELVAYASREVRLERGDLLFTGTPSGVGPVAPGDRLEAEIEKIGRLAVTVALDEA